MRRHPARRNRPVVPAPLVAEIEQSLVALDRARARLETTNRPGAPLADRRAGRAEVGSAFALADRLLRRAAELSRPGPYSEWRIWRHRLSQLDLAEQRHLFAESDDVACLGMGSVRAVDTGMSGPSIGELQHGHSRAPGTPARYGLDMAAVLESPAPGPEASARPLPEPAAPSATSRPAPAPAVKPEDRWPHAA